MKKFIVLLLVAVICLSLVACDNSNENSEISENYENRIAELEATIDDSINEISELLANYENKIAELEAAITELEATINRLLEENESTKPENPEPENPEPENPEPENPEPENPEPENPEPQYEAVEITLDNWQDYFELYAKNSFSKNAFGEFDKWHLQYYFVLKDGIEISKDNNKVALECKYTEDRVQYTIDWDTQTVTYGEIFDPASQATQKVLGMEWTSISEWYTSKYVKVFGCSLGVWDIGYNLEGTVDKVNNFEILRIEGTLYVTK